MPDVAVFKSLTHTPILFVGVQKGIVLPIRGYGRKINPENFFFAHIFVDSRPALDFILFAIGLIIDKAQHECVVAIQSDIEINLSSNENIAHGRTAEAGENLPLLHLVHIHRENTELSAKDRVAVLGVTYIGNTPHNLYKILHINLLYDSSLRLQFFSFFF